MAILKKNELRAMDIKQRKEKLTILRNELMKLRSQVATRTRPENPGRIKVIRKTIARIHTYNKILGKTEVKKEDEKKTMEAKNKKL